MRSGKNQFADYLSKFLIDRGDSVVEDSYAKQLKEWCSKDFETLVGWLNVFVDDFFVSYGNEDLPNEIFDQIRRLKIDQSNWWEEKTEITRILIQTYGTNIFRERVDENFWVKQLVEKFWSYREDYIIITDVRFPNEIDSLQQELMNSKKKELLGKIKGFSIIKIRINRDNKKEQFNIQHESETALDEYTDWDYVVNNNKSLEDLHQLAYMISKEI